MLSTIERATRKIAPGRAPSFIGARVIKALETISIGTGVGRMKLPEILGLGEGATRTLVRHLGNEGVSKLRARALNWSKNSSF